MNNEKFQQLEQEVIEDKDHEFTAGNMNNF